MSAGAAIDSASRLVLTPINKLSSLFKERFGVSEKDEDFGVRRNSDQVDTELTTVQKPDELEGSPYGRRKLTSPTREHTDTSPITDNRKHETVLPAQKPVPVRPPSPPVPPPTDLDDSFDPLSDKLAKQKEASKQALSSILHSVAAKHGKRDEGEPRYSFSSASSTDEMLPPPPLPLEPPPASQTPEKQLMTSTLFDRFSSKTTGKGKQGDREHLMSKSPSKTPSPTGRTPTTVSSINPNYMPASTASYGLPSPYEFYHQPVSKKYSPEVPSHPFSPGPHDLPNKPALSTIYQGQSSPSSSASESPPTLKARTKGELRSMEISSPVLVSSSNQSALPNYEQQHQHYSRSHSGTSSSYPSQQQPLSASNLQRVVYEYHVPSAPPGPISSPPRSSPTAETQGSQNSDHQRPHQRPLTLLHETSEAAQRTMEEILTQEIDDSASSTGQSNDPQAGTSGGRGGRQPLSAAAAVAEILANRQPLSVRISIQKHKTETSYKKSQSFGQDGQGGSSGKGNGGGGGGKKRENPFSESSL